MPGQIHNPNEWDGDCLFGYRPALERQTTVAGRQDTSREAARTALGRSGTQRVRIYELVRAHAGGLTTDDIQRLTNLPVNSCKSLSYSPQQLVLQTAGLSWKEALSCLK